MNSPFPSPSLTPLIFADPAFFGDALTLEELGLSDVITGERARLDALEIVEKIIQAPTDELFEALAEIRDKEPSSFRSVITSNRGYECLRIATRFAKGITLFDDMNMFNTDQLVRFEVVKALVDRHAQAPECVVFNVLVNFVCVATSFSLQRLVNDVLVRTTTTRNDAELYHLLHLVEAFRLRGYVLNHNQRYILAWGIVNACEFPKTKRLAFPLLLAFNSDSFQRQCCEMAQQAWSE